MNEHWGTIIWRYLHTMLENINNQDFKNKRIKIINLINYIGSNLPCNICSIHYKKYNFINYNQIFDLEGLKIYLWNIHNNVNKMKNNDLYSINILNQYEEYNYNEVEKDFFEKISIYDVVDMNIIRESLKSIL